LQIGVQNSKVGRIGYSERNDDIHPKDMHGLTDTEFQMLNELMPSMGEEEGRIHTLESVTIEPAVEPLWVWTGKE